MKRSTRVTLPYRLIHLIFRIGPDDVLNDTPSPPPVRHNLVAGLADAVAGIKSIFYRDNGLDYRRLESSPEYTACQELLAELQRFDLASLATIETGRAFWINVYNILIINAIIAFGIRKSAMETGGFFTRAAYRINGYRFSANDIEHGILRHNAGHPYIPGPQFRGDDPRLQYILPLDPRVHFSLNCAAAACPPISSYKSDLLDDQLDLAVRAFINNGGVEVDIDRHIVSLSRIFLWYSKDFAGNHQDARRQAAVLRYIAPFVGNDRHQQALTSAADSFRVTYQKYNWSLNSLNLPVINAPNTKDLPKK